VSAGRSKRSQARQPGKARRAAKSQPAPPPLNAIRLQIDTVDEQLQQLIDRRARLAQQVGVSKHAAGHTVDFYRPEREAQVLRLAQERNQRNQGPLRDAEITRLFREIMSACLAQEKPLKVAYLGPEGTYTQAAVLKHFGHSVRALALPSVNEVFDEVAGGSADFGVVAVENSTEGTVTNTLDNFLSSPLHICGEVELRIHHCLMGRMKSTRKLQRVCAHAQALAQCHAWLQEHLPDVERVAVASNAEGARRARDEAGTAAIAGETAAEVYGLNLLAKAIEDRPDNSTRFLVVGRKILQASGVDRTTLLVAARHGDSSGALYQLLEPLARHNISMTRIESRPSGQGKWQYVFFIDIEGHADDSGVAKALAVMKSRCSMLRVLGSYPRSIL
jgi:chorismate mutase / prephenate dehydratase